MPRREKRIEDIVRIIQLWVLITERLLDYATCVLLRQGNLGFTTLWSFAMLLFL